MKKNNIIPLFLTLAFSGQTLTPDSNRLCSVVHSALRCQCKKTSVDEVTVVFVFWTLCVIFKNWRLQKYQWKFIVLLCTLECNHGT